MKMYVNVMHENDLMWLNIKLLQWKHYIKMILLFM